MERIAAELQARHALIGVAIHHRVGVVEIGETSVVIAVSSAHRADALAPAATRSTRSRDGAALEEGDLRRRRGVDRPGLLSAEILLPIGAGPVPPPDRRT